MVRLGARRKSGSGSSSTSADGTSRQPARALRRALLLAALMAAAILAATIAPAAAHAENEEEIIKPSETQLRSDLFTSEVISELSEGQEGENGTLVLLETRLIDKVQELHPLGEAEAGELGAGLKAVHSPNAGETLGAAIEDLDAIVAQLGLSQTPQSLTPLLAVVRVAAKELGRELLQSAAFARPGSFDPYATSLYWWLGPPGSPPATVSALATAFTYAQKNPAFEGLLSSVLGPKRPQVKSSLEKLLASVSPSTSRMAERLQTGARLKEIKIAQRETRLELQLLSTKGDLEAQRQIIDKNQALAFEDSSLFTKLGSTITTEGDIMLGDAAKIAGKALLESFGDPAALALQLPTIISTIVSLCSGTPSAEEVMLEQLVAIERMIEQLGKQVQAGFAHVDANLESLGQAIAEDTQLLKDANAHIGDLTNDVAQLQEKLNEIEANQFEIAKTQREEALVTDLNTYVGYSERTPGHSPLPLTEFEQAVGTLFTYGTYDPTNAISELPPSAWPTEPSEIAEKLSAPASTNQLDFNLDYLGAFANPWGDGLRFSAGLPNPSVWADGASAFSQLLLENPQYVTEPLLRDFTRLKEVGATLVPELSKLAQQGASGAGAGKERTPSSVLNHALENYLQDGSSFLTRLQAEERYFLAQQDPGKEGEPNCSACVLARAPERGVLVEKEGHVVEDTGEANLELWGEAEQAPSKHLTSLETTSAGDQPEEGGARTPSQINACNSQAGEGYASHQWFSTEETPGSVSLEQTVPVVKERTNPLVDPLANVFSNAWHLGLGHVTTCYEAHPIDCTKEGPFITCHKLETDLLWTWYDNATGKHAPLLTLGITEPISEENGLTCNGKDLPRRIRTMWHGSSEEEKECIFGELFAGEHFGALRGTTGLFIGIGPEAPYEDAFALGLAELENVSGGKLSWADHSFQEVPGTDRYVEKTLEDAGHRLWTVSEQYEFPTLVRVHKEVEDQLRALRLATYRDVAPREVPGLSSANEDVHKAAATLNGARVLLDDYTELALPSSATGDPTLGKLLFGPGHLLDNAAGAAGESFEIHEYLTGEIQHEEEQAEHGLIPAVLDPSQKGSALEKRLTGRAEELASQLSHDLSQPGGKAQAAEGDQLIPETLAHLELAEFALLPEEAPQVSRQPVVTVVVEPAAASFTAEASGSPEIQWEVSTNRGTSFSPDTKDPGNKTNTLTVEPTSASKSGYEYRASFSNTIGSVTSEPAMLTVIARVAPKVTKQPSAVSVTEGEAAAFTAEASGSPHPSVQWEVSSDEGLTFKPDTTDSGNTTTMLTVQPTSLSESGNLYRARFSNAVSTVMSEAATLNVHLLADPNFTLQAAQEISGSKAGFTTGELSATLGQTVDYQVTVRNTGNVPLRMSNFSDAGCAGLSGGPGAEELAPSHSSVFDCQRQISHSGTYLNQASLEGTPPPGDGFTLLRDSNELVVLGPNPEPTVETASALEVGQNTAALTAEVNPRGREVTSCKFEYWSTALVHVAPCLKAPGAGKAPVEVSAPVEGLTPATTYHYRIAAGNTTGISKGAQREFTTVAATAPNAKTEAATEVGQRSAVLNAVVNPKAGKLTKCRFEYGTSSLEHSVACASLPAPGTSPVKVSAALVGLTPATVYRFRISVASFSGGAATGAEAILKTIAALPPTVQTAGVREVTAHTVLLGATVNPNGASASCRFEYWTNPSVKTSAPCTQSPGGGTSAVTVSAALKGLVSKTLYSYRISASSLSGMSQGATLKFKSE